MAVSRIFSNKCFVQLCMYICVFDSNIYINVFTICWLPVSNYICSFKP